MFRALAVSALTVAALATPASAASAAANLLSNPGFETGNLAGWSCAGGEVTATARSGNHALSATPAGQDQARCTQTVRVQPNSTYKLSAWVKGGLVYLGAGGAGMTGTSTWTPGGADWTQLSLSFTTGATTTSVGVFTHGWYGQPAYQVDDVVLDGASGGQPELPTIPSGLSSTGSSSNTISLAWSAVTGADGYSVYRDGAKVGDSTSTGYTDTGLKPSTTHTYAVAAYNGAGESARSATISATTGREGEPNPALPKHLLTGYWQNFVNGAAPLRIRDVNNHYDIIAIAFADADTTKPGGVTFKVDSGLSSALGGYSDADMIADIAAKRAQGKKFVFSIGGEKGNVDLSSSANVANFVSSMEALIRRFGVDGLDIDLEHGMHVDNVAAASRQLQQRIGSGFVLTMAPQTIDTQPGGRYLQLLAKIKDITTVVHTQYYNSGSMNGCDGKVYSQGGVDFITAQACILLETLRADQVALGVPASPSGAGSGYVDPGVVNNALSCLAKGTGCGSFKPSKTYPDLRGAMTWSINWDKSSGDRFSNTVRPHLASLG
ncbi:glycoside hydrolase family 18 protein [Allokutzneria sp. A3M-2-11 16]|uniref:chitinase n=1 Tax=Allokutzneria sp. A3M-2-11 16 TaxID=2962043 RepID=UPI0020B86915|nr:glycoside hydrolase family 18 protein [Allokutzneria sp. A3M-2-11 16]MCP3805469.1 glycoside hydrolase family 18 protein [Allokutzneria sp. A3M-2-11 16]